MLASKYKQFGGVHAQSAGIQHLLAYAGVRDPISQQAFSEAALFVISGGIGNGYSFCPSLPRSGKSGGVTIIASHRSYSFDGSHEADTLKRLGVKALMSESSSANAAQNKLLGAIEQGNPAYVWCSPNLDFHGSSFTDACTGGFYAVVVHAIDQDSQKAEVSGLAKTSMETSLARLAAARADVCTYKNRAMVLSGSASPSATKTKQAYLSGLRAGILEQQKPKMRTFSLEGLEMLSARIANPKSKQGWPVVYPGGKLFWALRDIFTSVVSSADSGLLRPLFADGLEQAAKATGRKTLMGCAEEYRALGRQWKALAEASLPSKIPAFADAKRLLKSRNKAHIRGSKGLQQYATCVRELHRQELSLLKKFPLSPSESMDLLQALRPRIDSLHAAEQQALDNLAKAVK